MTDQGNVVEPLDQEGQQPARTRRTRIVVASVVAGALLMGGGGGVAYAWNADQNEKLATATDAWEAARAAERAAVEVGRAALVASEGKVADDQVRQALALLLDGQALGAHSPDGSRTDLIRARAVLASSAEDRAAEIRQATEAVVHAQEAWELERAVTSYGEAWAALSAAIDAGAGVLSASEGQVIDNAVRQALADAITAADALRPSGDGPLDLDALVAASATMADASAALSAATTATTDAQSAWQIEQDRVAAEQASAAQAASSSSSGAKSTKPSSGATSTKPSSGATSTKPSSGATSTKPSSGATSTKPSSSKPASPSAGGGGWVVEEQTPMRDRCGDEAGNTWEC